MEQFQGREKPVIIISTVRSQNREKFENIDIKFKLGFVRNPKVIRQSFKYGLGLIRIFSAV